MAREAVFPAADRRAVDVAIRAAEERTRWEFSVFVGPVEGAHRAYAEDLHAVLAAPDVSVLLLVDPAAGVAEVVTGQVVRRHLDDRSVAARLQAATRLLAAGRLVPGVVACLRLLSDAPALAAATGRPVALAA